MRFVVEMKNIGEGLLSVENGYHLGSLIYKRLDKILDKGESKKLHGYGLKEWAISNIRIKDDYREFVEDYCFIRIRENSDNYDAYFYVSAMSEELAKKLAGAILSDAVISVPATSFTIRRVKVLESKKKERLRTLTPALFYNKATDHFYTIEELPEVLGIIRSKVNAFGGDPDAVKVRSVEETVVRFKERTVPGLHLRLRVRDDKTAEILYNTGVGHKATLGFGFLVAY